MNYAGDVVFIQVATPEESSEQPVTFIPKSNTYSASLTISRKDRLKLYQLAYVGTKVFWALKESELIIHAFDLSTRKESTLDISKYVGNSLVGSATIFLKACLPH